MYVLYRKYQRFKLYWADIIGFQCTSTDKIHLFNYLQPFFASLTQDDVKNDENAHIKRIEINKFIPCIDPTLAHTVLLREVYQ